MTEVTVRISIYKEDGSSHNVHHLDEIPNVGDLIDISHGDVDITTSVVTKVRRKYVYGVSKRGGYAPAKLSNVEVEAKEISE